MSTEIVSPLPSNPDSWHQVYWVRILCLGLTGALVFAYLLAVGTRFLINDDYQTLYTAWLESQGQAAGRDYYLTSYYLLVDLVAPLFRVAQNTWFPVYFMRFFFILVLVGSLVVLAHICRRLFDVSSGMVLPILLLSTTAMLQHGLDIRPDLLTNLLWLVMLLCVINRRALSRPFVMGVGALLAIATLNRFKALVILPLLSGNYCLLLWRLREGRMGRGLAILGQLALGCLVVLVPYLIWVAATSGLGHFVAVHRALFSGLSATTTWDNNIRSNTLMASLQADYVFWAVAVLGIVRRWMSRRAHSLDTNLIAAGILGTALLTVLINPAYHTYNLMTLYTLLAPFAAFGLAFLITWVTVRGWSQLAAIGAMVGLIVLPTLVNFERILDCGRATNAHQKDLQRFLLQYTRPENSIFALEGVGLFRPSVYHWRFPAVLSGCYLGGQWNYAAEWAATPPEVIVVSYRVPGWLTPKDFRYLIDHYVRLTPLILVPGFDSLNRGEIYALDVISPGAYEVITQGAGQAILDGTPVLGGQTLQMSGGAHLLKVSGVRCMLRRHYPKEAVKLLANPEGLPYFTPPSLELPQPIVAKILQ
jgi:hypothetical protein